MSIRGKPLKSQTQQMILNLLNYFEREKENEGHLIPLSCVHERVADAVGISISTIQKIKRRSRINPILSSPGKKRPRKKTKTSDLPESSKMVIRNTIYEMFRDKKHATVETVNNSLRDCHILLSNSSLNRTLHEIGFKFKREGNRRALIEKTHIAIDRFKFLKKYKENLNELIIEVNNSSNSESESD